MGETAGAAGAAGMGGFEKSFRPPGPGGGAWKGACPFPACLWIAPPLDNGVRSFLNGPKLIWAGSP